MPGSPKISKNPKFKRRNILCRDAASADAFEGVAAGGHLGPTVADVVTIDANKRANWKPSFNAVNRGRTKPYRRWMETANPTKRAHHVATPWRDASLQLKLHIAHIVLATGTFYAFTLDLGPAEDAKLRTLGADGKNWLANRLAHRLKAALNRMPRLWFRIEESDGKRPYLHIHGEIAFSEAEKEDVRKALKKAGGRWPGPPQTQLNFKLTPDTHWVSYATKPDTELLKAVACEIVSGATRARSWRDHRVYIERGLSQRAKSLYEAARPVLPIRTVSIASSVKSAAAPPSAASASPTAKS